LSLESPGGKVVAHPFDFFSRQIFPATIAEMKAEGNPGYHMIANNQQLNTISKRTMIIVFRQ
jgi:hypothetical protein